MARIRQKRVRSFRKKKKMEKKHWLGRRRGLVSSRGHVRLTWPRFFPGELPPAEYKRLLRGDPVKIAGTRLIGRELIR